MRKKGLGDFTVLAIVILLLIFILVVYSVLRGGLDRVLR